MQKKNNTRILCVLVSIISIFSTENLFFQRNCCKLSKLSVIVMPLRISIIIYFTVYQLNAQSLLAIPITDSTKIIDCTLQSSFLIDAANSLQINQVATSLFQKNNKLEYSFGFSPHAVWIKTQLKADLSEAKDFVLEVSNWYIDEADLYQQIGQYDKYFLFGSK